MDNYSDLEFDPEFDALVDSLRDMIDRLPKDRVAMIDMERYHTVMQAAESLKDILAASGTEAEIRIRFDELFCLGAVSANISELSVTDIPRFAEMICKADNFEIYPKTDGSIQLDMTFQQVVKHMPPRK